MMVSTRQVSLSVGIKVGAPVVVAIIIILLCPYAPATSVLPRVDGASCWVDRTEDSSASDSRDIRERRGAQMHLLKTWSIGLAAGLYCGVDLG
ncbi:hypothetical protein M0657_004907 [Pyricularia oryzae]|nr:hypothetical protein M9X92_004390 [Pyricularia oryzae]KAI7923897.1 hypothetical protein M0657_004907 [Pyricularia oryzae]